MIETRYEIEYINPKPKKLSSKIGKFFLYTLLTLSIFAAILALVFNNLPKSTGQEVTEKVQQFISSFSQPDSIISVSKKDEITESSKVEDDSGAIETSEKHSAGTIDTNIPFAEAPKEVLTPTQLEKEYLQEIERLSQEITERDNQTEKKVKENLDFTQKLEQLTAELEKEKQRSSQLSKEIYSLNLENKTVASLLKETNAKAESMALELKELREKESQVVKAAELSKSLEASANNKDSPLIVNNVGSNKENNDKVSEESMTKSSNVVINDNVIEVPKEIEVTEIAKDITNESTLEKTAEEEPAKPTPAISQIDAIIANMENNNTNSKKDNLEKK